MGLNKRFFLLDHYISGLDLERSNCYGEYTTADRESGCCVATKSRPPTDLGFVDRVVNREGV
jgi:hypothetical protein